MEVPEVEVLADVVIPDLGIIRYRDPDVHRQLWLGFEAGGVFVPRSLGLVSTDAWTLRFKAPWALALTERVAIGGRNGLVYYSAKNVRVQVQEHQLDLSARLLPARLLGRVRDRLAFTLEFHTLDRNWVEGEEFDIGGVGDNVIALGYGLEHRLLPAFELGWNVQARWVEVFINSQRQLRASVRPALRLGRRQRLSLELVAFLVHRDERQFGNPLERTSLHGQLALEHTWMSRSGVGSYALVRAATSFMSGQAPMFEIRQEAINAEYGEAHVGLRVVW